jgi:hypothetical protein
MTSTRRDIDLCVPTLDDFWVEASLSASIESATPEQQSWLVTVEQGSPFGSFEGSSGAVTGIFRQLANENEEEEDEEIFYDAEESCSDVDKALMNAAHLVENDQPAGKSERKQFHTLLWRILGWIKQISASNRSKNDDYDKSSLQTPPVVLRVSKSRSVSSPLSNSCRSARSLQASFDLAAESPERFLLSFSNDTPMSFPSLFFPYRSKE